MYKNTIHNSIWHTHAQSSVSYIDQNLHKVSPNNMPMFVEKDSYEDYIILTNGIESSVFLDDTSRVSNCLQPLTSPDCDLCGTFSYGCNDCAMGRAFDQTTRGCASPCAHISWTHVNNICFCDEENGYYVTNTNPR
jgi:hypothetical protein